MNRLISQFTLHGSFYASERTHFNGLWRILYSCEQFVVIYFKVLVQPSLASNHGAPPYQTCPARLKLRWVDLTAVALSSGCPSRWVKPRPQTHLVYVKIVQVRAGLEVAHGTGLAGAVHRATNAIFGPSRCDETRHGPRVFPQKGRCAVGGVWFLWAGWTSGMLLGLQRQASGLAERASSVSRNGWVRWNVGLLSRWHWNGCLLPCSPNTGPPPQHGEIK